MPRSTALSELESAVIRTSAILDLVMAKIIEEDRNGEIHYHQSQWVSDVACLVADVREDLRAAFYGHHASLRAAVRALRPQ
jgi:hypothetical protein